MDIVQRAKRIELLLMDCDGVLTDGRLYFSERGEEMKAFHVRDGQGIVNWHKAGLVSGIISGRDSMGIVRSRARELEMRFVRTGSKDKCQDLDEIIGDMGLSEDKVAFIGDDIGDLDILRKVGLAIAVADAVEEVRKAAHYVTKKDGGNGAVREVIDLLLSVRTESQDAITSTL
jgi:YrbI family 3-deoxy-D-manno-octulosonate 8-phosphate phosphatase